MKVRKEKDLLTGRVWDTLLGKKSAREKRGSAKNTIQARIRSTMNSSEDTGWTISGMLEAKTAAMTK